MAYSCTIDPHRRVAVVAATGVIDGSNIGGSIAAVVDHPDWRPGYDILWDGRGITELSMSLEQIYAIAADFRRVRERFGAGKTALVFRREIDYSIGYLYVQLARGTERERRVFRSLEKAAAWLGLPGVDAAHLQFTRNAA